MNIFVINNNILNVLFGLSLCTALSFLFLFLINIAMLLLIFHRLTNLYKRQTTKSVRLDILYQRFLVKYTSIFNLNFPMCAMILVKLHNMCSFNQFSICTTLIIFVLYLLSTEPFIKVIFNIWIAIYNLYNEIDGDQNIFTRFVDVNVSNKDTMDMKIPENIINISNKDTVDNVNETSFMDVSKENKSTTTNIKPKRVKMTPLLTHINKLNIGLMRTKGLVFKTNPESSMNSVRAFSTSNSNNENNLTDLNNLISPNIKSIDKKIITKPKKARKLKNSIFKGYQTYNVLKHLLAQPGPIVEIIQATNTFYRNILKDQFKIHPAVSVQVVINVPKSVRREDPYFFTLTPFFTITEDNLKQWEAVLLMKLSSYAQRYSTLHKDPMIYVIFKYKAITEKDAVLAASGHLWSPTIFSKMLYEAKNTKFAIERYSRNLASHNVVNYNEKYIDFFFTLWPKLLPPVWDWGKLSNVNIIYPYPDNKDRYFVENISIKNPFRDPIIGNIKLNKDEIQELTNEFGNISRVDPFIFTRNPLYLKVVIEINELKENVRLCRVFYNELLITEFRDTNLGEYVSSNGLVQGFQRAFANGKSIRIEGETVKYQTDEKNKNLYMTNTDKIEWKEIINTEFATYDFETRTREVENSSGVKYKKLELISYAYYHNTMWTNNSQPSIGFKPIDIENYNQENFVKEFLDRIKNLAINSLANKNKTSDRIFYFLAHNASRFDEIFMLKTLLNKVGVNDDIKIIKKDGITISLDWIINAKVDTEDKRNKNIKITRIRFLDSYLMLPSSLRKLAKSFNVEETGDFNVKEINEKTDLKAIMPLLREYNIKDCKILWNILAIHAKNSAKNFHVNIFTCPTASSFAFRVFRTNYLKPEEHLINITDQEIYNTLRDAYQGGASDVYYPTNKTSPVYYYDVNSEYPSMMAQNVMPTGKATRIIGEVVWQDPSFCGFVVADITCPVNLTVPLLSINIDGKTIAGAGTWKGTYFAAELREAVTLGYEVKAIEAIQYEGRMVFQKFIKDIYEERQKYPKTNPMNMICKLVMNSTYGRFGMSPLLNKVRILNINDLYDYESGTVFLEIMEISEDKVMVVTQDLRNEELDFEKPQNNLQISLPIAAAITSYARIHIHRIKMNASTKGILLYSDTDSVVCSEKLPPALVGSSLGKLKLEYVIEKSIFISPKFYVLKGVKDGKTNESLPDVIKAKGLKDNQIISYETFEKLLNVNSTFKSIQNKWFREPKSSTIFIKEIPNTLSITLGKRVIIVDINNKFIATSNVLFKDGVVVSNEIEMIGLPIVYTPFSLVVYRPSLSPTTKLYPTIKVNPYSMVINSLVIRLFYKILWWYHLLLI